MAQKAPQNGERHGSPSPQEIGEILMVGVGVSSADGSALQELLQALPASASRSLVLVSRPASPLSSLDSLKTDMPVVRVAGKTRVAPGRVYALPPDAPVSFREGFLCPEPPGTEPLMPID